MLSSRDALCSFYPRLAAVGVLVLIGALLVASAAQAAVTMSRAELSGTQLGIDGQASANRTITVDGVAMGTGDGSGRFRIERSGLSAPADCSVDVNDGSGTATTARLSGCTISSPSSSASLSSFTLSPTDVVGPDPATGSVTLSSAVSSGGFTVDLTSDNTAAATVPQSVTVPAGPTARELQRPHQGSHQCAVGGDHRDRGRRLQHRGTCDYHGVGSFHFSNGSIAILSGGTGSGRVRSQPAGIDCTIVCGNGTDAGPCPAFFPVGTIVRLDARPTPDSEFRG